MAERDIRHTAYWRRMALMPITQELCPRWEYRGFVYRIIRVDGVLKAQPLLDQSVEAGREANRTAALRSWGEDRRIEGGILRTR